MKLFDSHAHLQDSRIISNLDLIMSRAQAADVASVVCCGSTQDDWILVSEIAIQYKNVIPAFGLHPWYLDERNDGWESALISYLEKNTNAAVGEIGLDRTLETFNEKEQVAIFVKQIDIARQFQRPVSVHCRKAWGALIAVLQKKIHQKFSVVIHSYSGAPDLVDELVKLGCMLSFSSSILSSENKKAGASIARVPAGNLLLETDSPDISPFGKNTLNEPANLSLIVNGAARFRNCSPEDIASVTMRNGEMVFGKTPILNK
jgi:TatD DNase family protein